jgi:hypothetical protein
VGSLYFFSPPLFAHGHGRDARAAAPQALPATRLPGSQPWVNGLPGDPKVTPCSLFPLAGQPIGGGLGRPQLQLLGHGGVPVPATPEPPRRWDQHKKHPHPLRNALKQEAMPRSGRTQGPRGGAMVLRRTAAQAAFLPKLRRPNPTMSPEAPQAHEPLGTLHIHG